MGQNKKHQLTGRYVNLMNLKNFMLNERSQSQNCIHCMYILYVCTYSYMKFKNRQNQITVIGSIWDPKWKDWPLLGEWKDDLPIITGQKSEYVNQMQVGGKMWRFSSDSFYCLNLIGICEWKRGKA